MTKTLRLLLAEDDEDDRLFFTQAFAGDNGVEITACENGVELLNRLRNKPSAEAPPGVIVLDQNMPKLNGLETLRLLKADESFSAIPVIIYSTYADDKLLKTGLSNGALLVLDKPSDKRGYDGLLEKIRKAIED